jgi:opacity protein-like surface antigen
MKSAHKADLAALVVAGVVSGLLPAQAADLGYGSVKDGRSGPSPGAAVSPCYVRADVGRSWLQDPSSDYAGNFDPTMRAQVLRDVWFAEAGVGCGSGSRGFRGEVTLGIREAADFKGNYTAAGPVAGQLSTDITTYTSMFNLYYDLGNMKGVVPYVGGGIGLAYHDMGNVGGVGGIQRGDDKTSFAWSVMAGFGYQLTDRAILDIGYRYIDLGSASSSFSDGAGPARLNVDDIRAHEFKVGLRYHFGASSNLPR